MRHRLKEMKAPTIVPHSKYDQLIPLWMECTVASCILDARFVPRDSRDHLLLANETTWRDRFVAVTQFLVEKAN